MAKSRNKPSKSESKEVLENTENNKIDQKEEKILETVKPNSILQNKKMFFLFVFGLLAGMVVQHYQYQYFFVQNDKIDVFSNEKVNEHSIKPEIVSEPVQTTTAPTTVHGPTTLTTTTVTTIKTATTTTSTSQARIEDEIVEKPSKAEEKERQRRIADKKNKMKEKKKELTKEEREKLEEEAKARKAQFEEKELKRQEKRKIELAKEMAAEKKQESLTNEVKSKSAKQKKISQMKPKKMWIPIPGSSGGHRRVPAVEIKVGKEHYSSVKVWLYEEFLAPEECDTLVKVHEEHLQNLKKEKPIVCFDSIKTLRRYLTEFKKHDLARDVTPNDFIQGTMCINQTFSRQLEKWGLKWSFSTAFYQGESKFSNYFSKLIEDATMLNQTHGGKFQITSYPYNIGYNKHTDCLLQNSEDIDRYATFLVFLNDIGPNEGAETGFPELGITVKPKKGRALTWNSMNYETGKCEKESANEAKPLINVAENKKKYVIQRWYYNKDFYSIGKRIQEPEIPARGPNTPKVSCDEYDFGSCRLYDEWGNDHLLEYKNKNKVL